MEVAQGLGPQRRFEAGRILFVSRPYAVVAYSYPSRILVVSHPGGGKIRAGTKTPAKYCDGGVRGESPQPPSAYHTSRNPPGWP